MFDGNGNIEDMDNITVNYATPDGKRAETEMGFQSGTYEVSETGLGCMIIKLGAREDGDTYVLRFVVTDTESSSGFFEQNCEITAMDSFVSTDVGIVNQLVAPRWKKISAY